MSRIILFSRPIRSGKTTEIMNWTKGLQSVGGFLTPDIDNRRSLYLIKEQSFHPFETDSHKLDFISIGKFHFLESSFKLGTAQILKDAESCEYLVLDEIGKLEMIRQTGWEEALQGLLSRINNDLYDFTLIIVVRDFLLKDFIKHYKIEKPQIINTLSELDNV